MKLDDWVIKQRIAAGDWFAAASAVANLHGLSQLQIRGLTAEKFSIYFNMPYDAMTLTVGGKKYIWTPGSVQSAPSLAQGPWAVVFSLRLRHEAERLVDP